MQQVSRQAALQNDVIGSESDQSLGQSALKDSNVLFLQGPVGPFFARIAKDLCARGFTVHKINFNGGDKFFYRHPNAVDFAGTPEDWPAYLRTYLQKHAISRVYVFGDCRYYHLEARKVTQTMGIRFFVFEEGYIRPNFITLERDGVNGHSSLMKQPTLAGVQVRAQDVAQPSGRFCFLIPAIYSIMYYLAASYHKRLFKDYMHHRPIFWLSEGAIWVRSGYRKLMNMSDGKRVVKTLDTRFQNQYFLCPLQVHCDMQVLVHSEFESIDQFICEVISSFAKHAPCNRALVFKHHPLDRGYTNYKALISEMAKALHIDQRVFYVHDVCLPTMLRNAEGSVMINSTVGMSSLYHKTPVKVMGEAIYDRLGLTYQGSLDTFWNDPGKVDVDYVARFRAFLVRRNQLNGNLYKRCVRHCAAGVLWSDSLLAEHSPEGEKPELTTPRVRLIAGTDVNSANAGSYERANDDISKSA